MHMDNGDTRCSCLVSVRLVHKGMDTHRPYIPYTFIPPTPQYKYTEYNQRIVARVRVVMRVAEFAGRCRVGAVRVGVVYDGGDIDYFVCGLCGIIVDVMCVFSVVTLVLPLVFAEFAVVLLLLVALVYSVGAAMYI